MLSRDIQRITLLTYDHLINEAHLFHRGTFACYTQDGAAAARATDGAHAHGTTHAQCAVTTAKVSLGVSSWDYL